MRAIRDHLVEKADALAEVISRDNGKTRIDALATEVVPATMAISFYSKKAKKFLRDRRLPTGNIMLMNKRSKIVRVPCGVIGIVSPWNYPFAIPFSEVIMGLLAGNAVILKTASETQMVGLALKEAVDAARMPEGVFSFVNMPGRVIGDALLDNGIDKLFFTGSVDVGKKLMAKAAETLTPLSLELGGNDAMLVCEDADLHRAAGGAVWAGFSNCGQSCGGVERIYVHESAYEPFLEILKRKVEALRVGDGVNLDKDMGAMTTQRQIDTVNRHVEEALARGAVIHAQSAVPGDAESKSFLPATVLTNVNHDMQVMREETFGPVVGVMKVKDMEEAVVGLTGSVWTKNARKGEVIARKIQAGAVTINDHLMSHGLAETPWGGFKESGIGRTHGEIGFNEMTQPQVIVNDILPLVKRNLWWHPFDEKVYHGLKGVMEVPYARGLKRRLAGLWNLVKILPRASQK
jgi:succinate-semialdehyde dehydrogenase/glutarate-semialdehyde dehydrogenase